MGRRHEQVLPQQVRQGGDADAETTLTEKVPARDALEQLAGVVVPHVRHSLVSVSSRLSSTLATIVQAASSAVSPGAAAPATARAASGSALNRASCRSSKDRSGATSGAVGRRAVHNRNARTARSSGAAAASLSVRAARARAASKKTGSLSVVSACSGVLVRTRRAVQNSRLGASKTVRLGSGAVRRVNV